MGLTFGGSWPGSADVAEKPVNAKVVGGGVAAATASAIALAMAIIAPWEGRELVPYRDIVGIWTVCEGITGPAVVPGRRYSPAECDALLRTDVGRHYAGLAKCVHKPVAEHEMAALVSWTYNVGVGSACGSTLVRMLNAGRPAAEWCQQLLRWNRAGGREVRGLTNRRRAELQVCLGDLSGVAR